MNTAETTIIHELVTRELGLSRHLLTLLIEERELLVARKHQALTTLVDEKTATLQAIDDNATQRYQLLGQHQQVGNEHNWRALVEAHIAGDQQSKQPLAKQLQATWQDLLSVLKECKHNNEVNGKMIARSRLTMGRLLNLLRGQFDTPELYNAAGTKEGLGGSHTSVKA